MAILISLSFEMELDFNLNNEVSDFLDYLFNGAEDFSGELPINNEVHSGIKDIFPFFQAYSDFYPKGYCFSSFFRNENKVGVSAHIPELENPYLWEYVSLLDWIAQYSPDDRVVGLISGRDNIENNLLIRVGNRSLSLADQLNLTFKDYKTGKSLESL